MTLQILLYEDAVHRDKLSGTQILLWTTVGVGANVIEASWSALEQSVNYFLLRHGHTPR
jgi:hypothetical protein